MIESASIQNTHKVDLSDLRKIKKIRISIRFMSGKKQFLSSAILFSYLSLKDSHPFDQLILVVQQNQVNLLHLNHGNVIVVLIYKKLLHKAEIFGDIIYYLVHQVFH